MVRAINTKFHGKVNGLNLERWPERNGFGEREGEEELRLSYTCEAQGNSLGCRVSAV